ncbi:serine/threonine-protein kinase haspin-like [Amblyomma americanum]
MTSTALTCPRDVASVGASGISSRLYPSPSRLSLPSSSGAIFGELLPACHQRSPVKFAQFFNSIEGDRFKKIAEGEDSEVFHVFTYKGDSVLKVQQIDSTPECLDRLLSKITIASKLTELRKKRDYFTTCFVELRSVTCILDAYPEELIAARENVAGTPQQERRHVHQGQAEGAYLVWHMSYAGAPLNQIELESVLQLWSVLQQIALSLAVAEEALEFEHRALRLEHVLVKNTHEQSSHFFVGGRSFAVNTWGVEVHIAGYSSARITDGDSPVFTAIEGVPEDSTDGSLLCVYKHMASIIRDDWHAFLPLTNLLWVRHVTKELYRRYKTKFRSVTDHYEALAWSEIGSWRDQLLDYCSLGDFVEANFRADPLR